MDSLNNYVVLFSGGDDTPISGFQCWADSPSHAEEQYLDAYPSSDFPELKILFIWQGEFGIGIEPALDAYYHSKS